MDAKLLNKLLPKKNTAKASWASRNEGVHERVNFDDTIWGFDLAGGVYYGTPLRVTAVYPDSRAEKAGIRPGDKLNRVNDIDTSTLTIQQAHDIIVESGVYIRLAVSAPEDTEDSYGCFVDSFDDGYDSEEERRKEAEKIKKRKITCKTNSHWSLMWPWTTKRKIIYRESNCFMVPSAYEVKHKDRLLTSPVPDGLITLQPIDTIPETLNGESEPVEPEPVKPELAEPKPVESELVEQGPVEPELVEPKSVEPELIESELDESELDERELVDSEQVESETVEPESVEPELDESEPVESEQDEPELVGSEPVESELDESEPVESELVESELSE